MQGIEIKPYFSGYELEVNIRRDENGKILSGLSIAETTHQNQALILLVGKGEVKDFPTVGVGIAGMINDNDFAYWCREIMAEMEKDGQQVSKLQVTSEKLILEAKYK